jgi:murein DD-endopeptidase MepM/ murein hydrolase activator NlpD
MGLNPFKDANLNDLQENIIKFFFRHFGNALQAVKRVLSNIHKKGNEKVTLMFIPHSEKRIINFHISIFTITFIVIILISVTTITSVLIVNHTSTIKEVSKLKIYGADSKIQIQHYKEEINKLYDIFQKFKPELTYLYSLTPNNYVDSLWAKGGATNSGNVAVQDDNSLSPSVEVLNIEEMNQELETTKKVLKEIKKFLENRKKIIENTPSLWPVNGSIVATFGNRMSPFSFKREFYQGIDIAAFPGAEIHATAPGTVQSIEWDAFLGLTITIKHKYGFFTRYSHCQRVAVDVEQKVKKGEVVGYVGKTGKAARHMCHYQIKIGTDFVDPMPYLNKILYK